MKPTEKLGEAVAPDGTVLALYRHDGAYGIRVHGVELMSTRRHHSEDRLAELVCAPLRDGAGARVLIGGLGLGFTLKAALRTLPDDAHVVVAELVDAVIAWNRNPEWPLAGDALADPRVELRHADVADLLREGRGTYDGIMLDVDNGAEAMTTAGNAGLYGRAGIRLAADALRRGGRVAWWSAGDDRRFEELLARAKLVLEIERPRAHATAGGRHTIFVGRVP
ncbi:MAG: spermidine synthase [Gemmatirosa sp.]